jgi:hypothetical protein
VDEMAEIKMSLEEYQELTGQRDEAERARGEMAKKLADAEMADPTGRVPELVECIRAGLAVVKFAVGNLAPETVRGWPYADLKRFAEGVAKLPGADAFTEGAAHEFQSFINGAREIEELRRARDEQRMNPPAQAPEPTPEPTEAAPE